VKQTEVLDTNGILATMEDNSKQFQALVQMLCTNNAHSQNRNLVMIELKTYSKQY